MSTVRSTARPLPRDPRPHRRVLASVRTALVWAVAASAVNVVIWLIARLFDVPMAVAPDRQAELITIGPLIIVGATLFAALLAGLVAGILAKFVQKVLRWVVIGGVAVTLASLTAPWGQSDQVPTATRIVLTLIHISTGALVTTGLARGIWTDDRSVRT